MREADNMTVVALQGVRALANYGVYNYGNDITRTGIAVEKAVSTANQRRLAILSNAAHDKLLVGSDLCEEEKVKVYPAWTGTLTAFEVPEKPFMEYVTYTDRNTGIFNEEITYRFKVPSDYKGAKDALLLVEHGFDGKGNPIYEIHEDGKNQRIIYMPDESKIGFVQNFPAMEDWYLTNEQGIPVGKPVLDDRISTRYLHRYLYRLDHGPYVGLAARCSEGCHDSVRYVLLGVRPSERFGVLVEDTKWSGKTP